jgi:CRISPR-associated protein Cas2
VVIVYVLIVYDVGEKRVSKVLKFLKTYLNWIQNSVFEGEVTEAQLHRIRTQIYKIIDSEQDSVIIFSSRDKKWLTKSVIGKEKNEIDVFI